MICLAIAPFSSPFFSHEIGETSCYQPQSVPDIYNINIRSLTSTLTEILHQNKTIIMFFVHYIKSQLKYNALNYTFVFNRLWIRWQTVPWIFRNNCATTLISRHFLVIVLPATKFRTNLIYHDESWYDTEGLFKLSTGHKLGDGSQIYSCY